MRNYWRYLYVCLFVFIFTKAKSQNITLSGKIFEKETLQPVLGASISLKQNGKLIAGTSSDANGFFQLKNLLPNDYELTYSFIGLKSKTQNVTILSDKHLGAVFMDKTNQSLNEVKIEANQIRVEQKGDTTSINASAFKVNPDATAEDLVKKMPGITIENGTIKAQGEEVKKILLDGKEFFGDDAQMALKNLPAEIVDKVQVFNRLGDQAQFTGFNDGNTDKTMNITTKSGKSNGKFGKIYAGYGTNDRYQAGLNLNQFKGNRRITVLGLSNNINQQNFSMQDLFGSSGSTQRMPMGGGGRGNSGNGGGGMGEMSNFLVGQQSGISTTNSIGINYSDKWGKKAIVSGSYFFNNSQTKTNKITSRNYPISAEANQFYDDSSGSKVDNFNNRFSFRLEYTFDSSNALIFSPKLSFQNNTNNSNQMSSNVFLDTMLNSTITDKQTTNLGYSIGSNVLFRHKFIKVGRTISINFSNEINRKEIDVYQQSEFFQMGSTNTRFKQFSNSLINNNAYSANLTYTEQLSKIAQLQISYNPGLTQNFADKQTNGQDTTTMEYTSINPILSNTFDNTVNTQKGNVSLNINKTKYTLTAGITQQVVLLESSQTFPLKNQFNKKFVNLLPNLVYQYKFTNNKTLKLVYRTNTNTPSINQLQNVIDNSNPLQLSSGNPDLKQEYSNTILTRYGINNAHNSQSFFLFAMATFTNNYIANGNFTATQDSVLPNGILLPRGSQISQPVNLNGNINVRSFATFGIPIKKIKSNLNLNLGVNYSKVPGKINSKVNFANTLNLTGGMVLGSNISERVDFTITQNANVNLVNNSLTINQSSNYFVNTTNLKTNLMPTKSWVISSEINYTNYQGLGSNFNQDFLLWNGGIAYKFLNKLAEVKVSVFDILNQNNSVARNITETYIEDTRTNVVNRYVMVTFTYNIRKFIASPPIGSPNVSPSQSPPKN